MYIIGKKNKKYCNKSTFEMYGISLNLEFLKASSPLTKRSNKGVSFRGVFNM